MVLSRQYAIVSCVEDRISSDSLLWVLVLSVTSSSIVMVLFVSSFSCGENWVDILLMVSLCVTQCLSKALRSDCREMSRGWNLILKNKRLSFWLTLLVKVVEVVEYVVDVSGTLSLSSLLECSILFVKISS